MGSDPDGFRHEREPPPGCDWDSSESFPSQLLNWLKIVEGETMPEHYQGLSTEKPSPAATFSIAEPTASTLAIDREAYR